MVFEYISRVGSLTHLHAVLKLLQEEESQAGVESLLDLHECFQPAPHRAALVVRPAQIVPPVVRVVLAVGADFRTPITQHVAHWNRVVDPFKHSGVGGERNDDVGGNLQACAEQKEWVRSGLGVC